MKNLRYILAFLLISGYSMLNAQQIKFDNLKEQFSWKNAAKINGGFSANAIYYNGDNLNRQPFTWVLSANLNLNIFSQINLPFSFVLNNMGSGYTYPSLPNQLSLHPSYKWIAAHIGEVSMSFSPYTLSGIQFTGAGVELTPDKMPFEISAMYGRLVRTTPYHPEEPNKLPAYKRMGGGVKFKYSFDNLTLGMSVFGAKDDPSSVDFIPATLNILPQSNVAMSWDASIRLIRNLSLNAEYGLSILNHNISSSVSDLLIDTLGLKNNNTLSSAYNALKLNLTYQLMKNTFGIGYERIDPEYKTLGAYYFTNDLENITVNFARPFFKDKITFSANIGIQHDDLESNNIDKTQRIVGAVNLNYNITQNLSTNLTYSNFQSYTNKKTEFDYINQASPFDHIDTLDYLQLSQNAGVNIVYGFGKKDVNRQSINGSINYQESAAKQGGIIDTNSGMKMYNTAVSYNFTHQPTQLTASASFNFSNTISHTLNMKIYGPNMSVGYKFFDKKLTTMFSFSYNISQNGSIAASKILNTRINCSYMFLKRNNFSLSLQNQQRTVANKSKQKDFTTTFSYAYNF